MPNISDIAKMTGVSTSTVSRSLRNDSKISAETKQKVMEVAKTLGYVRHIEKNTRTAVELKDDLKCVGLIVPEVMSAYYARLAHFAAEYFAKQNYSVTIRLTNFDRDAIVSHVHELCASYVSCLLIIVDDSEEISGDIFSTVSASGKPAFFITAKYLPNNDFDSIFIDERRGIHMMLDHLVDRGYKSIGFIGESQTIGRRDAYIEYMSRLNLPVVKDFVKCSQLRAEAGGYQAMREILASKKKPDAIFMSYDQMAIGAIKAIKEAGLTVPGDIAVAAFDDIIMSEYIENGLTTVQSPCEDMIAIASRVLLSRVEDRKAAPQQIALKPTLIIRGTT